MQTDTEGNGAFPEEQNTLRSEREIVEACLRTTRIRYLYRDGFFTPKLKSLNYLELGRSKIISNPLTILIEWIYVQYKCMRDWFREFCERLFPRSRHLYGNQPDSSLVGRIVYPNREANYVPLHHIHVEFWGRTWWLQWRKFAEGITDDDGYFNLRYELRVARNWKTKNLQFEIYQISRIGFEDERPHPCYRIFQVIPIAKSDLIGMAYNLRTIQLPFWEYRRDTDIPRVLIPDLDTDAPEYNSQGRSDALIQQIIPIELTKVKHLDQIEFAPGTLSIQEIQSDYPVNLTVCIEKHLPGYTRGDDWFGERMMNGMNRGYFLPIPDEPGHYWIKYFGACDYSINDLYALPTAEVKFKIKANGLPLPIEIHLTGPLNIYNKDPWQKRILYPENEPEWLYAKRLVRVTGAVSTEVDEHFTGTHLNTEQYAIAAHRNLRLNPVAFLLMPHLKEVSLINHAADKLLVHQYLPTATALTYDGIQARTRDMLGVQDWKGWLPMKAITEAHTYALAETLFWEVVGDYVDLFFALYESEIKQQWLEIFRFSQDLVEHSVPVFLSDINPLEWSVERRQRANARMEYYCRQYAFDPNQKRVTIDGQLKVVSPITSAKTYAAAGQEDMQNLKEVCRYAIMMATWMHSWINEHQYDDLGEILYSGGGLRFGDKEAGVLAPETDLSIAQDLTRSTQMLWFTNFLARTEYGFITCNEEGDVNPVFIRLLQARKSAFDALGVDIDAIESRTNI